MERAPTLRSVPVLVEKGLVHAFHPHCRGMEAPSARLDGLVTDPGHGVRFSVYVGTRRSFELNASTLRAAQ
jgi:hypothetical protein